MNEMLVFLGSVIVASRLMVLIVSSVFIELTRNVTTITLFKHTLTCSECLDTGRQTHVEKFLLCN